MKIRYALLVALFMTIAPAAFAQDVEKDDTSKEKNTISKPSRDFLMIQFMYTGWLNAPDSVNTTGIGRSFNAYLCYDFPIKSSRFSFAAGVGVGTDNVYLKDQEVDIQFTDTATAAVYKAESRNYSKYKVSTAYLEAPFELRYFGNKYNRNKGFKAAIGMRVGTLVGTTMKGKEDGTKVIHKVNSRRYMETWRFAGTARLGYGNFTLMGTYNLTNLYKENQGPALTPFSIGLCITGL